MRRFVGTAIAGLAAISLSAGALAAQPPTRVRGTITSVSGNSLTIKTYDGSTTDVMLQSGTKYAWVVPSSLSNIKKGEFIGTAAKGPENDMVAQEVVIFPNSMRGAGEGHYPWTMPAAVANADAGGGAAPSSGAPPVQGTMTNGTVAGAGSSANQGPPVEGTMTNGTVAANSSKSGGKQLTISYDKGQTSQIMVPANVPIVRFEPAHKSILKSGEKAFVVASSASGGSGLTAMFVAVGKNGLMPPM